MTLPQLHYGPHGGGNDAVVARFPHIVGDRLVHFVKNNHRPVWVLRDFVTRQELTNETSPLTVAQIEADADYSELPAFHSVENVDDWQGYLRLRTMTAFNTKVVTSVALPNPKSGSWRAF